MKLATNYLLRTMCLLAYAMVVAKPAGLLPAGSFDRAPPCSRRAARGAYRRVAIRVQTLVPVPGDIGGERAADAAVRHGALEAVGQPAISISTTYARLNP